MKNEINQKAVTLRKMAEKILKARVSTPESNLSLVDSLRLIHQLEVHQIELEMQNVELESRNNEITLEKSISQAAITKYTNLYDQAPTGYFVLTREGEIIDLNLNAAEKLGIEQTQLQENRFVLFVSEDTQPIFNDFMERMYESQSSESCQVVLTSKADVTIHVHISGQLYEDKGWCFLSVTDITARIEKELQREITRKLLRLLNEPGNMKETVHKVLLELKNMLGYDAIGIRMKEGADFPYFDQVGFSVEFIKSENSLLEYDRSGKICRDKSGHPNLACTCGLVISGKAEPSNPLMTEGGSWWVNDSAPLLNIPLKEDARFHPRNLCIYQGFSSIALVPIRHNASVIGLMQFNDHRKERFNSTIIEHLEEIASHIGGMMLRKQAEEKLQKNEELLRTITINAPDIILQVDRSGTIVYINREMYGCKEEDCIGKNFCNWTLPGFHAVMKESLESIFTGNATQQYLSQETDQQGENRWVQTSLSPIKTGDEVRNVILVSRDVTNTIRAEQTIRENDRRHRMIVETAMDGFCVVDHAGRITEVNESYARMSGYTAEELRGMRISDLEDRKARIRFASHILDIMSDGDSRFETQHKRKDGSLLYVEISIQYQEYRGGQFVIFIHDITERKLVEENLRQSEERYKSLFQDNHSVMLLIDPQSGQIRDANPTACHFYGWSHNELCRKNISEINILTPEEIARNMQHAQEKKKNHFFFIHRLASGEMRDVEVYSGPIGIDESTLLYTIIHDITEQKKAEEALRISEEKFRNLVSGMQAGVLLFNPDSEVILGNPKALELLGIDENRLQQIPFFQSNMHVIHEDGTLFNQEDLPVAKVLTTGKAVTDCIIGIFNSSIKEMKWILIQAEPQISQEGELQQVLCTFIDISELKKKDEALKKLNQTLTALSKSSQAMVHTTDEADYLGKVCNIVMNDCGYAMVWIGFAEEDEGKSIKPVANAGFEDGYLDTITLSWGENEYGNGPTGKAIRSAKASICTNMLTDPTFSPWRENALKRGYSSSIAIPLLKGDQVFGAMTIYSREIDPFTNDEVKLLNELSSDLAYGITAIRLREAHQEAQSALSKSYEKLEELVKLRTRVLEVTNEQLNAEIKHSIQQEQHLKIAEEKYRTVADFTYNMETWIDPQGKYIYVSPSSEMVTGYLPEAFMSDSELFIKIAHPDDKNMVDGHFKEKIKGHFSNCSLEYRIITPGGEVRWIGHSCQMVFNATGQWIGQRGSNRNITKQKLAEQVLIESKNHLRALTHRMDVVAEEERIRISREIHDELGHLLTALKYDVEGLINHSELTIEFVKSELKDLISMIESLIDSVRKIATELRPGILDHLGLFAAIEWKIKQFRMKNKINCEYHLEEMYLEFDKDETTMIYRILQEIFTNVSRHSKAKNLWISIYKSEGNFIMRVRDDGIGFTYNASLQTGSLGLLGMNERAMSIGGEITIESEPGNGTTITLLLKK